MNEFGRFLGGEISRRQFLKGTAGMLSEVVGFTDDGSSPERSEVLIPIDTLRFFRSPSAHLTLDGTHKLSQSTDGNTVHYIRWGDRKSYEMYTWDESAVYLGLDRSNSPQIPYRFSPGKWMNRTMYVGDEVDMTQNAIQWFSESCEPLAENSPQPPSGHFPYITRLLSYNPSFDTGGPIGSVSAIELEYDLRPQEGNFERYTYGEGLGLVRWEEHDGRTGDMIRHSVFNRLLGGVIDPDMSVACS